MGAIRILVASPDENDDLSTALSILDTALDAHPNKYWFLLSPNLQLIDLYAFTALNLVRPRAASLIDASSHLNEFRLNVASDLANYA